MELRQLPLLRPHHRARQHGARRGRPSKVVPSALSQQISRLESELSARLLQRGPRGVLPTEAGAAFFTRKRSSALRHADQGLGAPPARPGDGQRQRLAWRLPPRPCSWPFRMLGGRCGHALPRRAAAYRRESLRPPGRHAECQAGDSAVLFLRAGGKALVVYRCRKKSCCSWPGQSRRRIARQGAADFHSRPGTTPADHAYHGTHGLRATLDAAFTRALRTMKLAAEIDSLSVLMGAVDFRASGATVQPPGPHWGATSRCRHLAFT